MAYQDLREFIRVLEKNHELRRISVEVDPVLEITEFADRAVKQGGPALLFEKPKGYGIPVLINCFASMRKMELARALQQGERPPQAAHQDRYAVRSGACVTSKAKDLSAVMLERFGDVAGFVGRPRIAAAE